MTFVFDGEGMEEGVAPEATPEAPATDETAAPEATEEAVKEEGEATA